MLEVYTVIKARENTTHIPTHSSSGTAATPPTSKSAQIAYNSSASAVAGIWLVFTIWFANMLRAKRQQLQFPVIIYSIFTIVASTNCTRLPNVPAGQAFVNKLLQTFLTGFGLSAGVALFIFPITSRMIVSKQIAGFLQLTEATLSAHHQYRVSISQIEEHSEEGDQAADAKTSPHGVFHGKQKKPGSTLPAEAQAVKAALANLGQLFGKIHVELSFAKREAAYGKLGPHDYDQIFECLRDILLPVGGVTTFVNIMETVRYLQHEKSEMHGSEETYDAIRRLESEEWDEMMKISREPYKKLTAAMHDGLSHSLYTLELARKPKAAPEDVEAKAERAAPGDDGFAGWLEKEITDFHMHRVRTLKEWCARKGIDLPSTFWDDTTNHVSLKDKVLPEDVRHRENHQQLYLVLYLEYLTWSIGRAILALVHLADGKVKDGTMKKKRFIFPTYQALKRWFLDALKQGDTSADQALDDHELNGANVYAGDSLRAKKDPEHLPPTNAFERFGDVFRKIPALLRSPESGFGARATLATMTVGILAFLEQTQIFFIKQRLTWAMIMIAIGMSAHAGQGVFGFMGRIVGTVIAMCTSLILWYMADKKTGAVLPLYWFFTFLGFYVVAKFPKFVIVAILAVVTQTLIIGYELEVRVLGVALATSNGQPAYPIGELAPYRLACVASGLGIAFIWTYFPYPVTTHNTLRKDLGATMYLLANYYSCVHTTFETRLRLGALADESTEGSPGHQLMQARAKVFGKIIVMLAKLRESSGLLKFDVALGGKFPKDTYDQAINSLQNIFNYMSLIAYATRTFSVDPASAGGDGGEESAWLADFRVFAKDATITTHDMTSMLCLMSASLTNAQPLPPYLKTPRPYNLREDLESVDPQLLSIQHIDEPCYAAFAVLQVASSLVTLEMEKLVR